VLARSYDIRLDETESADLLYTDLRRLDLLWLTGHNLVSPDADRLEQLKVYLDHGGTLVAVACCGRKPFDEAFVEMIEALYGPKALVPIPPDDPLISGRFSIGGLGVETGATGPLGSDLGQPRMRRSQVGRLGPVTTAPASEGTSSSDAAPAPRPAERLRPSIPVLRGVRVPHSSATGSVISRWAVIYSPIDIHCGCDGHLCIDCNGYDPRDARAIAANIILSVYLDRP
jgi:hypothetical protein